MQTKMSKFTADMIGKVIEVIVTDDDGSSIAGIGRLESVQVTPSRVIIRFTGETQPFSLRWDHSLKARIDVYDF